MLFHIISIFPDMFKAITTNGVIAKAFEKKIWDLNLINPRDFADNRLGYIDDRPFGGEAGMVMKVEPLYEAISSVLKNRKIPVIYLSPKGEKLTHKKVKEISTNKELILICGRYEGIDERVLELTNAKEVSIGDFVTSGGELPAMLLMDAVLRLVPGVINEESILNDSFVNGLLEHPHYSRPFSYKGLDVPDVLVSGNHEQIKIWKKKESLRITYERRPDLLSEYILNPQESILLDEIKKEH